MYEDAYKDHYQNVDPKPHGDKPDKKVPAGDPFDVDKDHGPLKV